MSRERLEVLVTCGREIRFDGSIAWGVLPVREPAPVVSRAEDGGPSLWVPDGFGPRSAVGPVGAPVLLGERIEGGAARREGDGWRFELDPGDVGWLELGPLTVTFALPDGARAAPAGVGPLRRTVAFGALAAIDGDEPLLYACLGVGLGAALAFAVGVAAADRPRTTIDDAPARLVSWRDPAVPWTPSPPAAPRAWQARASGTGIACKLGGLPPGSGQDLADGHVPGAPRVLVGRGEVSEEIGDPERVRPDVLRQAADLGACASCASCRSGRPAQGRVELGWTLAAGHAPSVYGIANEGGDPDFFDCVMRQVASWTFDPTLEGDVGWAFTFAAP